jgi:hypothetical protein
MCPVREVDRWPKRVLAWASGYVIDEVVEEHSKGFKPKAYADNFASRKYGMVPTKR